MTIPITVLTGFLGSGKTTLLNRLLSGPALSTALVVVNELGEIPLDHELVREAREDVLVLASGCVCCSVRGDLVRVLCEQYVAAAYGRIPPFNRVFVETTGLADPTPILATLTKDPELWRGYRLASVVTTVDAVLGRRTLAAHEEAEKQVALADQLVMTKIDLARGDEIASTEAEIRPRNPHALLLRASRGELDARVLLSPAAYEIHDAVDVPSGAHAHAGGGEPAREVRSFSVSVAAAVDFSAFAAWLSLVTQLNGEHLLRIKGLLCVKGEELPVVVQAVQHVVYPVTKLGAWPTGDRSSRLVAITRGLDSSRVEALRASLLAALGMQGAPRS